MAAHLGVVMHMVCQEFMVPVMGHGSQPYRDGHVEPCGHVVNAYDGNIGTLILMHGG